MIIFLIAPWVVAVATAFILKNIHIKDMHLRSKALNELAKKQWFSDVWKSGITLFLLNLITAGFSLVMFILITYLDLSILFLFVGSIGILVTVFAWIVFRSLWTGSKKERFVSALIGTSFYIIAAIFIIIYIWQIDQNLNNDSIGPRVFALYIALYLSINAGSMCIVTVGLPSNHDDKRT
ncbi:hypothetical protein [Desulfuribacillus alkaliarsenatis]|uniref:Uncharacterized protein n=1 Tax=Desulfuribacillus alkaliarsenatis TaxID=766136 RepID=A0A1E5FYR0_9FIRM|nr:hypothetical protein [Desulfuribacillus alkaliarsenatis]OEF95715.1 hypothetical protein BHF68_11455 [Desulfuribacillus alkaliarsenatis]